LLKLFKTFILAMVLPEIRLCVVKKGEFSMKKIFIAIVGLPLVLAGCQSTGPKQSIGGIGGAVAGGLLGSQIGSGEGRLVATGVGAALGALLGSSIGAQLDEADQQRVYYAQTQALETQPSGSRVEWRNPDSGNYGYVTPGPAYQVNNRNCRDYTHTIYVDGRAETARGTACRQPDGTWLPVS
jgi:surface antigen